MIVDDEENDEIISTQSDQLSNYKRIRRLGKGSFGDVFLAEDLSSGELVALKHVRMLSSREGGGIPKAVFRELESLRQLQDCHRIVTLRDSFPHDVELVIVFDYHPSDLAKIIASSAEPLPRSHIKAYAYMILDAVNHCHQRSIIHRDIKPSNILISSRGDIKLADFGLARICVPAAEGSMSHQVATRWYRAPELLFASRHYTPAVDIWAVGAILAELLTLSPLFPGCNDIDQIHRVFQVMGTPTVDDWPDVGLLPDFSKIIFPDMAPLDLNAVLPQVHSDDIDFLKTLLRLNPEKRLLSSEARSNEYFQKYPFPASETSLFVIQDEALSTDAMERRIMDKTSKLAISTLFSNAIKL